MRVSYHYHIRLLLLPAILASSLIAGCAAGVTSRQMRTDSEVDYGLKEQVLMAEKRMEFDQLADDFLLTRNQVFLAKMANLVALTDKEIEKARIFLSLQPPYHRGIALARRKTAEQALRNGEKQLCEMMLAYGELHLVLGDPAQARGTLESLNKRFVDKPYAGYREKATLLLREEEDRRRNKINPGNGLIPS